MVTQHLKTRHFEQITTLTSAKGFTSTYIPPTDPEVVKAIITPVGGDIRYRVDGTSPTDSVGTRLVEDSAEVIEGYADLNNFRAIEDAASSGLGVTLEVHYLGTGVP